MVPVVGQVLSSPGAHGKHQVNVFGFIQAVDDVIGYLLSKVIGPVCRIESISDKLDVSARCFCRQPLPKRAGLFTHRHGKFRFLDPAQFHQSMQCGDKNVLIVEVVAALVITDAPCPTLIISRSSTEILLSIGQNC